MGGPQEDELQRGRAEAQAPGQRKCGFGGYVGGFGTLPRAGGGLQAASGLTAVAVFGQGELISIINCSITCPSSPCAHRCWWS